MISSACSQRPMPTQLAAAQGAGAAPDATPLPPTPLEPLSPSATEAAEASFVGTSFEEVTLQASPEAGMLEPAAAAAAGWPRSRQAQAHPNRLRLAPAAAAPTCPRLLFLCHRCSRPPISTAGWASWRRRGPARQRRSFASACGGAARLFRMVGACCPLDYPAARSSCAAPDVPQLRWMAVAAPALREPDCAAAQLRGRACGCSTSQLPLAALAPAPRRYGAALEGHLSTCDALLDTVKQASQQGSCWAAGRGQPCNRCWVRPICVLGGAPGLSNRPRLAPSWLRPTGCFTCHLHLPPHTTHHPSTHPSNPTQILDLFERLREQHRTVATRTSALHGTCERLVAERRQGAPAGPPLLPLPPSSVCCCRCWQRPAALPTQHNRVLATAIAACCKSSCRTWLLANQRLPLPTRPPARPPARPLRCVQPAGGAGGRHPRQAGLL